MFEHGEEWKAKLLERKMKKWEVMYIHNSRKCRERNAEKFLRKAEMPQHVYDVCERPRPSLPLTRGKKRNEDYLGVGE